MCMSLYSNCLGCVNDYGCYAVVATVYSKLHDTTNALGACQKGCSIAIVTDCA